MLAKKQNQAPTIVVMGDYCVDKYVYGAVERLSPEAPVPILKTISTQEKCGMAGNVSKNISALGGEVVSYFSATNSVKVRYIDQISGQHMLRVDNDCLSQPLDIDNTEIPEHTKSIVISDYNKGFITKDIIKHLQEKYKHVPIFIDTKKQDLSFITSNCFVKINEHEYNRLTSTPQNLIVTKGSKGVVYNKQEFSVPSLSVFDVTGAGDTFLAALAYTYSITNNIEQAIKYAIAASSVTITKLGVYAPTPEEIDYET